MKLYRNFTYPNRWYAHSNSTGWVMFPAVTNGWDRREPARGIDPIRFREVPLHSAAGTGLPAASGPSTASNLQVAA
jgi:hypothetical protein